MRVLDIIRIAICFLQNYKHIFGHRIYISVVITLIDKEIKTEDFNSTLKRRCYNEKIELDLRGGIKMGFLDKVLNGVAGVANFMADCIDRKSDEQLEQICSNSENNQTPAEMRNLAARAHMYYEQRHSTNDDNYDE